MVRFPGKIPAGSVSNEIVSHLDWFPTILAVAGEPDIAAKLKKGHKIGNKTYKVHLDGFNLLPHLTGMEPKSPRQAFIYFTDDGDAHITLKPKPRPHARISYLPHLGAVGTAEMLPTLSPVYREQIEIWVRGKIIVGSSRSPQDPVGPAGSTQSEDQRVGHGIPLERLPQQVFERLTVKGPYGFAGLRRLERPNRQEMARTRHRRMESQLHVSVERVGLDYRRRAHPRPRSRRSTHDRTDSGHWSSPRTNGDASSESGPQAGPLNDHSRALVDEMPEATLRRQHETLAGLEDTFGRALVARVNQGMRGHATGIDVVHVSQSHTIRLGRFSH
jgi:hypothetical protein